MVPTLGLVLGAIGANTVGGTLVGVGVGQATPIGFWLASAPGDGLVSTVRDYAAHGGRIILVSIGAGFGVAIMVTGAASSKMASSKSVSLEGSTLGSSALIQMESG
jgi:hypothetical protein